MTTVHAIGKKKKNKGTKIGKEELKQSLLVNDEIL